MVGRSNEWKWLTGLAYQINATYASYSVTVSTVSRFANQSLQFGGVFWKATVVYIRLDSSHSEQHIIHQSCDLTGTLEQGVIID
jgi:hypothetical protein